MAYCGPLGLPHSQFLGGDGSWTELDRQKALAWQELDRQTCTGCGTRTEEWDPAQGGNRHAYAFDVGICPGCEAAERTQATLTGPEWKGQRGIKIRGRRNTHPPSTPPPSMSRPQE